MISHLLIERSCKVISMEMIHDCFSIQALPYSAINKWSFIRQLPIDIMGYFFWKNIILTNIYEVGVQLFLEVKISAYICALKNTSIIVWVSHWSKEYFGFQFTTTHHRGHFLGSFLPSQCIGSAYEFSYALPTQWLEHFLVTFF